MSIYSSSSDSKTKILRDVLLQSSSLDDNRHYYYTGCSVTGKRKVFKTKERKILKCSDISFNYHGQRITEVLYKEDSNINVYVLLCSKTPFEDSQFTNKKFVLTKMVKMDYEFIVNNGHFYEFTYNNIKSVVYIVYKNKLEYEKEIETLNLDIGPIVSKVWLIDYFYN